MKRIFAITSVALLALFVLVYASDYLTLRYRIVQDREPFGSVTVRHYYAVREKNGKTEFMFNPPETQTCVHSLFPHFGYPPCWYLNRHTEQRIDL
jgi:hypothetical protein